ncbi:hypothetical protein BH10ACT9_BH10ACT9_17120 [soil metagenome]
MAAFWLSGCGSDAPPAPSAPPPPVASAAPSRPADLPQPSALLDVLNRLSDPAVPGTDKLVLVEGATDEEAAGLEAFSSALRDNKMLPLEYSATDIVWSQTQPGYVGANVTATAANSETANTEVTPFSYPMEFKPVGQGWQLSRQTADLLLEFGRR